MNGDSRTSDDLGDVRPGDVQHGAQGSAQQRRVLDLARNEWPCLALGLLSIPIILYGLGSYSLVNGDEHIYHVIARTMVESGQRISKVRVTTSTTSGSSSITNTFIAVSYRQ